MRFKIVSVLTVFVMLAVVTGCASDAERQQVRRGAGVGTVLGAAAGLALAAATGESEFIAAGAGLGAAYGAAYEYDQARDDRRTKQITDAIGGAQKGETADNAGKRHFQDFLGDWNLDIWALNADGTKLTGSGHMKATMESKDALRMEFSDIRASESGQAFTGAVVLKSSERNGFSMETRNSINSNVGRLVGEYIPAQNAYNFYPSTNKDGETVTGVIRSKVRLVLRVSGTNLCTADTFSMIDGKEVQIQSYRLTR